LLGHKMLRKSTDIGVTQLPYEAMTCGNCKFKLSHANAAETPCKSVNRCTCFELPAIVSPYAKSMLRHLSPTQAIYRRLQTAFTDGWRNWVGLRWYLMKLQNAESAFKRIMSFAYLRNCSKNSKKFTNAFPVFGHRVVVTYFADSKLQFPHTTRLELTFVNFAHLFGAKGGYAGTGLGSPARACGLSKILVLR